MSRTPPAVALCNYRYFLSGGPERYMFAVEKLLRGRGHMVAPFAARYPQNAPTPFARYFVPPPTAEGSVYFEEHARSLLNVVRLAGRCFYSLEAKRRLQRLMTDGGLDVAYILQHHNVLSPSIIAGAKDLGRRVVVRLSDFTLLCPAYHFLKQGRPCEACFRGLWHALPGRCNKRSLAVTSLRVASMYFHRLLGIYDRVDAFVAPTQFLRRKMILGGVAPERIHHVPTFVETAAFADEPSSDGHILYVGRLSPEKGVEHLLRAYQKLRSSRMPLVLVGTGPAAEEARLRAIARQLGLEQVDFRGFVSGPQMEPLFQNACFVVVPSVCYENLPNVVLEAFAAAKPVIASRIGSLPEIVTDGVEGLLFAPADAEDLAVRMDALLADPKWTRELGENARRTALARFSPGAHYAQLARLLEPSR